MAQPPETDRFALNHMAAPQLGLADFFTLAASLGLKGVEIRNDIEGRPILDGTPAGAVREAAREAGVDILTINALQRFNDWTGAREAEAVALADYASAAGARAIVLVPINDGTGRANGERQGNLRIALKALKPILEDRGLAGLVEPLGFEVCSLRSKAEAAHAIAAISGDGTFRLVHDTFHHFLAGEPEVFAEFTGLVHISGVSDPAVAIGDMRDGHRVLVDAADRLGNVNQIEALLARGYAGPLSFEPFAEELRALADPAAALKDSIEFVRARLIARAA
jgi:2-keto-myo-inositol isomerase